MSVIKQISNAARKSSCADLVRKLQDTEIGKFVREIIDILDSIRDDLERIGPCSHENEMGAFE